MFIHMSACNVLMSAPFRTSELMVPWTCTHSHMLVYNTYWCQHHPGCQNWCWQTPGCMSTSHLDCLRARSGHSQPDPSRRLHGQRSWNNTRGALICHDKVQFNTSNQCMMEENVCCFFNYLNSTGKCNQFDRCKTIGGGTGVAHFKNESFTI